MKKLQRQTLLLLFYLFWMFPMAVQANMTGLPKQEMNRQHVFSEKKVESKRGLKNWLVKRVVGKMGKVVARNKITHFANLSLVFGGLSLLLGFILIMFSFFLALLGVIFSIKALSMIKKSEDKEQYRKAKNRAILGLVICLLLALLPILIIILILSLN
jgi:uncharacterized membrane protein